MGSEGGVGSPDQAVERRGPQGEADELPDGVASGSVDLPRQSPLFHAQHSERYHRQELIGEYERLFNCRLVVVVDSIFQTNITMFEEVIADARPDQDLHLLLDTPGGDGEAAIRLVRSAQARCHEFTVIVPNQAKSAGTLLAMGAHHILMGPTSDLGPVDPQFEATNGAGLYSAKDLIAAVDHAEQSIATSPESYPLHVALLADVNAVMVQQARSALERSGDLVREALESNPDRGPEDAGRIAEAVKQKLIDLPTEHGAVFDHEDAAEAGLPVIKADPSATQWKLIWMLWTKYFNLYSRVTEGRRSSQVFPMSRLN
jgi:hypothetical protein